MTIGILSDKEVNSLNPSGSDPHRVIRPSGECLKVGESSFDLPLGHEYWVMKGSCRTGRDLRVEDLQRRRPRLLEVITNCQLPGKPTFLARLVSCLTHNLLESAGFEFVESVEDEHTDNQPA